MRHQPFVAQNTCAHVFPLVDFTEEDMVSVYSSCCSLLYRSWRSFVLNLWERVGCKTVRIPHCVVFWIVCLAWSKLIPHLLANTSAVILLLSPCVGWRCCWSDVACGVRWLSLAPQGGCRIGDDRFAWTLDDGDRAKEIQGSVPSNQSSKILAMRNSILLGSILVLHWWVRSVPHNFHTPPM